MKFKGIIFDLDGTLLDTIDDLANATNDALEKNGLNKHPVGEYKAMVGSGIRILIQRACGAGNEAHGNNVYKDMMCYYAENFAKITKPYEGIKELLDELSARGYMLGVNSNKHHDYVVELLKIYFPEVEWKGIEGVKREENKKPSPFGAAEIIRKMKLVNKDVLYVGDTETDVKTARNVGIEVLCVTWGFRSKEDLAKSEPNYFIDHPKQLLDVI